MGCAEFNDWLGIERLALSLGWVSGGGEDVGVVMGFNLRR
jgi:hypothetical protein